MTNMMILGLGVAFIAGAAAWSIINWLLAETDERRWRRRMQEERQAALIRQHRYGTTGGGRKRG